MPVGEMLERMSSREITGWIALARLENDEDKQRKANARAQQALDEMQSRRMRHRR